VSFAFEVWRRPSKSRPPIADTVSSCWLRTVSLADPFGALPSEVVDANSLKDRVVPCGLEPQTANVSNDLWVGAWVEKRPCITGSIRGRAQRRPLRAFANSPSQSVIRRILVPCLRPLRL
jgi:hypothetical protein